MKRSCTAALGILASTSSFAGTGIYLSGYGTQEQGMAGATIAVPQSAVAAANNPAGMAFVGDRFDVGFGALLPVGGTEYNGVDYPVKRSVVPFGDFGYNKQLSDSISLGVSTWASGGGVDYGRTYGSIPGNSRTSSQTVFFHVAPTVTYRFAEKHALAFSFVGAISTMRLDGIEAQTGQSNQGRDWKPGYGFKLGWLSELSPYFSVGAVYASKVKYRPFSSYAKILPDGGRFEEPEHFGLGIAIKPVPDLVFAFDWLHYNYAKTKILGNPVDFSHPAGSPEGPGFGVASINVYRVGAQYGVTERLKLRAGVELSQNPIQSANTMYAFALPVTPTRTFTIGATYKVNEKSDLSFAYAFSPRSKVVGSGASAGVDPYMTLHYVALGFSYRF